MELTHISLFTGIGGIDLAAEWAGFETILMVENNAYCQKVLKKQWPNVPILEDIKDVTKEEIMAHAKQFRCLRESTKGKGRNRGESSCSETVQSSNKSKYEGGGSLPPITLITGGFPCQPVSQAGKRRGKEDDRWLWPEMLRVISEVRPTWVVAENVTGLLTMGFYDCLSDLESKGYETQVFVIPACGVNAPHRRDRIFIVAYHYRAGCRERWGYEPIREAHNTPEYAGEDVADCKKPKCQRTGDTRTRGTRFTNISHNATNSEEQSKREPANQENTIAGSRETRQESSGRDWWSIEPDVGRVAHGIPSRVDRLRALGNAVVPQQIYPILKTIADIEHQQK